MAGLRRLADSASLRNGFEGLKLRRNVVSDFARL